MALLPGDAGSQPVRFQPRPAPAAPPPSQWRGFPGAAPPAHFGPVGDNPSDPGYSSSAPSDAYKQTPAYRQAIIDTFLHQPKAQAQAIVRGALRIPSLEGHAVLNYISSHGLDPRSIASGGGLSMSDKSVLPVDKLPGLISGGLQRQFNGKPSKGDNQGGVLGTVTPFGGPKGAAQILKNTGKDAINLPAETFATVGTLGGDIVSGNLGKLASDTFSPYINFFKDPRQALKHPLDTALMFGAPLHGATRLAAGGVRAVAPDSAAGQALSTARPSIQLAGNLTHERPRYSPYPLIKAGQVGLEKTRFTKSPTGQLVPRSQAVRDRLTARGTSALVGVNERIRQANRDNTIAQRLASVTPARAKRVANSVATSLKRGPQRAIIPGAGVLARIADGTIRRPDTIVADISKHLEQVSANRPNLLDNPKLLKEHDAYVNSLQSAPKNKAFRSNPGPAFKAAASYASDYKPVQTEAAKLGHFGGDAGIAAALQRRELMHYAVTHMGAHMDPERGLVASDALGARPLSNAKIIAHIKGPEGTGGRMPAFTSDRPKAGSAFYIPSERRPLPQTAKNTLFAYGHGLTDPSHQSLLEQHVRMQGVVDAHKAQNRTVNSLAVMNKNGKPWESYSAAQHDAPPGYAPISLSQPFHPQVSLDQALHGTNPAHIEQEALTHSLDLSHRLSDSGQGRWGLADTTALKRIEQHKAQITSNPAMRAFKMTNNQFRQVALGTSAKHIPGVISESLLRDVASGAGVASWITAKRLVARAIKLDPEKGTNAHIQLTGGTVAGSTKMMMTRQVSDHFAGTSLYTPLKAFEAVMRTPGPRQVRTAWNAWSKLVINGTKKHIEENHQMAALGKAALQEFGATHGPVAKALRLQGSMLDDAARGLFDPVKARQFRAQIERIDGHWTDLTPSGQTGMMLSPFGLWWTNSVKWVARLPLDHPVKTGVLASSTIGTEKARQAKGLDLFSPGAVPAFEQGGIPIGNKVLAQNYYSPFGIANDALQTGTSLISPWMQTPFLGAAGDNWLGKPLTSPTNPKGRVPANQGDRAKYVLNSLLATFVPFYSKAEQIAQGGASPYDSSTLWNTQTKQPGQGAGAGLLKSVRPYRLYNNFSVANSGAANAGGAAGGSWKVAPVAPATTTPGGGGWKIVTK